jgi:hypothetical protein
MATGIYGNESKVTFEVNGQGQDQWVSFYHQSKHLLASPLAEQWSRY